MSALPPKADAPRRKAGVRFGSNADISKTNWQSDVPAADFEGRPGPVKRHRPRVTTPRIYFAV